MLSREAVGVRGPAPGGHRPVEPAAGVEPGAPRGPAALRPGPGRRGRAERAGPPRGLAGPPGVHRHHPGHRPDGHPGRARPGRARSATWPGCWAGSATTAPSTSAGPPRSGCSRTRNAPWTWPPAPTPTPSSRPVGLNGSRGTLYLHVTLADLATHSGGGRVERLGTASLDPAPRLAAAPVRGEHPAGPRPGPHRQRRRPRPTRLDAGAGDPPGPALRVPRLHRRRPVLRPRPPRRPTCPSTRVVLPARPRRQNLACLCRRHHRAKTFAGWRYRRLPDDGSGGPTYEWTSPHLRTHRVHPAG